MLQEDSIRNRTPASSRPSSSRPSPAPSAAESRPLNVTDALSYLDAVKVQFQDKPDVYNHFLDIMKDFKSQVIDTPGVIERVSTLFTGNPYLIQGFNTFLPQGYRIDISADPLDANTITVTTPMGTTTQSTNGYTISKSFGHGQMSTPTAGGSLSRSHTPHGYSQYDQPPYGPNYNNTQTAAAASFLGNLREEKQPVEQFNHAIAYLNKIKARYPDDGHIYKQFLELLQTYQKEQKHVMDSQVFAQVQILFKDAPDLMSEFKDFLPPPASTSSSAYPDVNPPWNQISVSGAVGDAGVERKVVKRKKKTDPVPPPVSKVASSRSKKIKPNPKGDSPSFSPYNPPRSPPPLQASTSMSAPALPPPATSAADRLLFFDRARNMLQQRDLWDDFLKLLNMFSSEIIDVPTLMERSKTFLGESPQLVSDFKELISFMDRGEGGPPGSIRTGPPEALAATPTDEGQGPSYRKLPASEVRLACSGRDELCRSVLNDGWVSHPTWASEEAGFIAHKKNTFEEALHKSEEERHEYYIHLESITRTISLFQPLSDRIEEMTPEERAAFRLPPDFGGPSKSIYYRMIRKIYGRDAIGWEVIQALQDSPGVTVPVVLARLKQKDEEWRRAHREWSKTWREVDTRNFYKSLDHQGISFKVNDKKQITAKHFIADIQNIKEAQRIARDTDGVDEEEGVNNIDINGDSNHHRKREKHTFTKGSVGHQLEYSFQDMDVLHDSLKLVYTFLDHSQVHYSSAERRAVEKFLRHFMALLCMRPLSEFGAASAPLEEDLPSVNGAEPDNTSRPRSGKRSPTAGSSDVHSSGIAPVDLRKRLLKAAKERKEKAAGGGSRIGSPSPATPPAASTPVIDRSGSDDIWIHEAVGVAGEHTPLGTDGTRSRKPFFANTTFYTLLRLLQTLYSRLLICKEAGATAAENNYVSFKPNPIAIELGLDDPNGPPMILAQAQEAFGKAKEGSSSPANVLYLHMLDACEKVFDGEMDQGTFEEHMRWFFKNGAYHTFTLDKLLIALIKQIQTILGDYKCQELWELLQLVRNTDGLCNQDIIRYRREAERRLGLDEHLYKIEWMAKESALRIRLVGSDDPSVDCEEERWREYADATAVLGEPEMGRWAGGESIRIEKGRYKIVYSLGGEGELLGRWTGGGGAVAAQGRAEWLREWLR